MNQKTSITNRSGLKVVVLVEADEGADKLVFIAHGQKGRKDEPHIQAFANAFRKNGYAVVLFDATHSVGESEGDLFDVTYDSYVSDLEDVIEWGRTQEWFKPQFALCGHSMGAQSTAWYAEHHPEEVLLLATMAPVVNFELHATTFEPGELEDYKMNGYKEVTSLSQPGVVHKIGWACQDSMKRYDLIPLASSLVMPVINIVGSEDQPCPVKHQEIFMNAVGSSNKQLIVINGLQHSYRNAQTNQVDNGLEEVEKALNNWLKDVD